MFGHRKLFVRVIAVRLVHEQTATLSHAYTYSHTHTLPMYILTYTTHAHTYYKNTHGSRDVGQVIGIAGLRRTHQNHRKVTATRICRHTYIRIKTLQVAMSVIQPRSESIVYIYIYPAVPSPTSTSDCESVCRTPVSRSRVRVANRRLKCA